MIELAGLTYLDATNWRYENYGTADLLSISGTTLKNLPITQSQTGTAFYQTTRAKCFDLPTTSEVWIKFDVYCSGSTYWRAYNDNTNGSNGLFNYDYTTLRFWCTGTSIDFAGVLKLNQLQTVLLHMMSDSSAGVIEAWVDCEKIYTYTGDVNHGEDFADIYLQSDSSGTFFSNVIISNVQIGLDENVAELNPTYNLEIKPEIYISWIPTGQVCFKPLIFATYIPAPEKVSADTNRAISIPESARADSLRHIAQDEHSTADLLRYVVDSQKLSADTLRKIFLPEKFSGDTFRQVVQSDTSRADSFRQVKYTEKVVADTSRKNGITITSSDLLRNIVASTKNPFDTCRKLGEAQKISADTYLKIARTDSANADTFRAVTFSTSITTDTFRKVGNKEIFAADTSRFIGIAEKISADTFHKVTSSEKAIGDLRRALREFVRADTLRKVTQKEKAIASTVIRVPHIFNYIVQSQALAFKAPRLLADTPSLVNTFKDYGVTAINITLSEKTLSDNFTFNITKPVNINDAVKGSLLDYHFDFLVEEITQTDLNYSVKGRYSQDDLLYTWFLLESPSINISGTDYEVPGGRIVKESNNSFILLYPKAVEIITKVAEYFGLVADVKIDDFTPSNLQGDDLITYSDLLSAVFNWTSRVPQRQVNIFIRGNVLHCIQRGKEDSVFDITDLPHSRPTFNKKFNRVLCHNPNHSSSDDDDDDKKAPYSGTLYLNTGSMYSSYTYHNGLLIKEQSGITTTDEDGKKISHRSSTTYIYESFFNLGESKSNIVDTPDGNATVYFGHKINTDYYVKSKVSVTYASETEDGTTTITQTETQTSYEYKTTYSNGDYEVYLCFDKEVTTKREYEEGYFDQADVERDIRETYYAPMGNGFYAQTVYLNGKPQGANISQGKPGSSVSQYTIDQFQQTFIRYIASPDNPSNNDADNELSLIVDDSFPVRDSDTKNTLNEALRWLHRKVCETVTVDLISWIYNGIPEINHVVDFTERIKLDGKEYFLVSNKIAFTPRKLIQKLELIRWY